MRHSFCMMLLGGSLLLAADALGQPSYVLFEAGQVRPLALSPDGSRLFAVNTPDGLLEIFDVDGSGDLTRAGAVQVGLEPVAVAARTNHEVWVVNHLSDSVSVVDLSGAAPRVVRTLLVGDEPRDVVFAGPGSNRAFITTAHRGQHSPTPRGQFDQEGIGRADVWVFDATSLGISLEGDELTVITLFSDKPRALAVSPDGSTVYVASFRSGNRTTSVSEGLVCDTAGGRINNGSVEPACTINSQSIPGGTAPPHKNAAGDPRPEVGLIVQFDREGATPGRWADELDRDWSSVVKFDLPDRDVFAIDANASPPVAIDGSETCANGAGCWARVGTSIFNMVVHPTSGRIFVSNTEAQNHVRFEGPGVHAAGEKPGGEAASVRGNLAQSRITILDGASVTPRHLNSHLDYSVQPAPTSDRDKSLAMPLGMDFSPDGNTLYVAAFGSGKIGVIDVGDLESGAFDPDSDAAAYHTLPGLGGPSGVLATASRLYVLTRFDNTVHVLDRSSGTSLDLLALHSPEPEQIIDGRLFLYDAQQTSSNGEASCASCHLFGDMDDLGWDLGNPDDVVVANGNPFNPVVPSAGDPLPHEFHPMKGPMTTQSLRGLANMGPQHWRGDRQGDAVAGFEAFNVAFPGLVGRDGPLSAGDMTAFREFALELRYPPNPIRQLDGDFRADEAAGAAMFAGPITDIIANCNGCHTLNPANGHFGGDGQTVFDGESQHFKIPHLRNAYQKVGMFGMGPTEGLISVGGDFSDQGPQVRGFGYLHDGAIDTLKRFFSNSGFDLDDIPEDDMVAFMLAFPSDLAPVVGQQVTADASNWNATDVSEQVSLLQNRAATAFTSELLGGVVTECDLIAKVSQGGRETGYLYDGAGNYDPDDGGAAIPALELRELAQTAGQEVTWTCVPPGSGQRVALDRDEDALLNAVETNTGIFNGASDTGSDPALADSDGDGFDDGVEVLAGTNPVDASSFPGSSPPASVPSFTPTGLAVLIGLLALTALAWVGRPPESR